MSAVFVWLLLVKIFLLTWDTDYRIGPKMAKTVMPRWADQIT